MFAVQGESERETGGKEGNGDFREKNREERRGVRGIVTSRVRTWNLRVQRPFSHALLGSMSHFAPAVRGGGGLWKRTEIGDVGSVRNQNKTSQTIAGDLDSGLCSCACGLFRLVSTRISALKV